MTSPVVEDFEFCQRSGNPVERVYCLAQKNIETGEEQIFSEDQLKKMDRPPISNDNVVLSYSVPAEMSCYLALGWPLPENLIDLHAEAYILMNDGNQKPPSMVESARHFGITSQAEDQKEAMRSLAMSGRDLSGEEMSALGRYCLDDVRDEARLWEAMRGKVNAQRGLFRGDAGAAFASMRHRGVPMDVDLYKKIQIARPEIRRAFIDSEPLARAVFTDDHRFNRSQFAGLLVQREWDDRWPRSEVSGIPKTDRDTFQEMRQLFPEAAPLGRTMEIVNQLNQLDLPIGDDGRLRCGGGMYGSLTGRVQPRGSIHGKHRAFRNLILAPEDKALVLGDFSSQEVAVAAILSGDKNLLEDLRGDIYMRFAARAGMVPLGGEKADYPSERKISKECLLGLNYGMGPDTLAKRIGRPVSFANDLVKAHRREYPRFHQWQDDVILRARFAGKITAPLGWSMSVDRYTPTTQLKNWLMQSSGSEILRATLVISQERGLELIETVHDGFLFQVDAGHIEEGVVAIESALKDASEAVLGGCSIDVDTRIVLPGERHPIDGGEKIWSIIEEALASRTAF